MLIRIQDQIKKNLPIVVNASSLFSTQIVTSGLGFLFWWLAARLFDPALVGLSSAAISAMLLMGDIGKLGLDTFLVGELPRKPDQRGTLITTSLLITGLAGLCLGILFALGMPLVSDEFMILSQTLPNLMLFALGVSLTSIVLVMDQALVGLLQGQIQLQRNTIFSGTKLLLLFLAGMLLSAQNALLIYATWAVGNLISLSYVAAVGLARSKDNNPAYLPQIGLVGKLSGPALKHYALNLTLKIPGYTLPLLVTTFISVENTASFYSAWMIANFLFALPFSFARTLFAAGSSQQSQLKEKIRFTLKWSGILGTLGAAALLMGADLILSLFGDTYAEQGATSLRILAISIFPVIIKTHFVALSQIFGQMIRAAKLMGVGALLELGLAAIGALLGGLAGLSLGWVIAIFIEGLMTVAPVYRTAAINPPATIWEKDQNG